MPCAAGWPRLSLSTAETWACRPFLAAYSAREAAADDSPQAAEPVAAQPVAALAGEPTRFAATARTGYAAAVDDPSPDAADSARVDSLLEKAESRCVPAARMDGSQDDCSAPVDSAAGDSRDSPDSAGGGLPVAGSAADDYSELGNPVAPRVDAHSPRGAGMDGSLRAGSMNSLLPGSLAPACLLAGERADSFPADCSRPADCLGDFPQQEVALVSPAEL